jgi:peptidoglycan lytic transglycosylase D
MKKYLITIGYIVLFVLLGTSIVLNARILHENKTEDQPEITNILEISAVEIPDNITFAGEKVPLELYYVHESFDRELTVNTYWHSSTLLLMKRSGRYFPIIEPLLKANGIPDDFKYLALIESGFENVTSPAGAVGFWQFLKGTAKDYGLEVNKEVDERYHLGKATVAACKYFLDAYEDYQDWTLVAASFNAGKRGINRQIKRQKEDDYYDLLFHEETERYIFRILAMKSIFENPEKYGFVLKKEDLYPSIPTEELTVDTAITNLADFAQHFGINYRLLKEFNPWLRQSYLKNRKKKSYSIKIPEKEYLLWQEKNNQW